MLIRPLTHNSLLDELFFWAVKYEFPQKLATFLLSLLPNDEFKVTNIILVYWYSMVIILVILSLPLDIVMDLDICITGSLMYVFCLIRSCSH